MPKEIHNSDVFRKLIPKAQEIRVVREKESVKLKLRTSDYLYTYKTNEDEAEDLVKFAKDIEVIEYSVKPVDEKKAEKEAIKKKEK